MADQSEIDQILAQYGPRPLPDVRPREMREPQLGQHNLIDRLLSSYGQPTVDALRRGIAGQATPREIAEAFLTTGPVGPFGVAKPPSLMATLNAVPKTAPEVPVSAATRYGDHIFRAPVHGMEYEEAVARLGSDKVRALMLAGQQEAGFVTSTGRFVTRDEAARLMANSDPNFAASYRERLDNRGRGPGMGSEDLP